ncbi:MAG: tRNA (adenosine(37)-N6)-threonylcarbamoyltransferase complex dimerization subunit type 1 TsaB [Moraxellaceae bacterium]|nr:tRNA (adenosine(37)-N6)-threonylcarbamoyltransferase complex dimerization subunit type 1 TsaB [Moraxellaceae bacterium]
MRILALETSCEIASVAVLDGDRIHVRQLEGSGAGHSASVMPSLRALLADASLRVADCDVVAFGAGPGAFTGLRLACGVAQGLALGVEIPVAPVSSLLALATLFDAPRIYCAMDARMNEAYVAAYERVGGQLIERIAPVCVPPDQAPLPQGAGWLGIGTAFRAYPALTEVLGASVTVEDASAVPTAAAVARLATDRALWIDPALAAPHYVRDKVAQTVAERLAQGGRA